MPKRAWIYFFALAVLLILAVRLNAREQTIKIGILTPLTGDVASWGVMQRNSSEMAVAEINSAGGIHGRKVQLLYEDDKATPSVGVNGFRKLVDVDKVTMVIGTPASNVTLAVAKYANNSRTVLLSSGSTAQAVAHAGPYIFRIMPSDEVQATIMANWAKELGFRRIAILYVENSWGRGLADSFKLEFEKAGGNIVSFESTQQTTTDFRVQIQKVRTSNPEAIFAPLYTKGAGLMIRQARELGVNQQILGADVYETPELIETGGQAVEGVLYTTYSAGDGEKHDAFAQTYRNRYGREPEAYAFYCYDAINIAFHALRAVPISEPLNGPNIRKALLAVDSYEGVTGLTKFAGSNSASGKSFVKWTVKNGRHARAL